MTAMAEADRGYLPEESKKTFTIVAGVLGALFFVLQFLLPMEDMFVLMPDTFSGIASESGTTSRLRR